MIEAPIDRIDRDVELLRDIMARASSLVLGGPTLRTDFKTVRYPDHYTDSRGDEIWEHVTSLLKRMEGWAK